MSRIKEKLRLPIVVTKSTTGFLSHKLSRLSLSTGRFCKSVVSKTLTAIFSYMDDLFFPGDDFDLDYQHRRPLSIASDDRRLLDEEDEADHREKLYLVPCRWLKEAQSFGADESGAVLYAVSSNNDNADSEIVLDLRKEEDSKRKEKKEEEAFGREYALVPEALWLRTLKRHNNFKAAMKDVGSLYAAEHHVQDVFPLQIRFSPSSETNSLVVKIRLKDNVIDLYKRACNIFSSRPELLHIWDFSGQTSQFFVNDRINLPNNSPVQPEEEILLELHVHGFSDSIEHKYDETEEQSKMEYLANCGSAKMNGSNDSLQSYLMSKNSSRSGSGYRGLGLLGLTGLQNLGNTCFMNSAIQCLVHTPELVDYFLGDYQKEINYGNPLGMNGELALAFGDLLRRLWAPGSVPVAPRMFKLKLSNFAPQFSGYNQHDSQEFLAFLLDGLHEDLNRVKCKPYMEVKDAEGREDEEVAEEYWRNHLARNDSIIVDMFQGQYRSTLICPVCKKVSVTFDPFMYLSLPLPSTTMRTMTLTVLSTDGVAMPFPYTVTVPKCGRLKDLIEALSFACSLRNDETLLVAEIYKNHIFRLLDEPSDSLALIRDDDKLVTYRLPKDSEASPLIVFMHQRVERSHSFGRMVSNLKFFGIPLVARLSDFSRGSKIRSQFLKLLNPFLMPGEDVLNDYDDARTTGNEDSAMEDTISPTVSESDGDSDRETRDNQHLSIDFQFYLMIDKKELVEIKMNEPLLISRFMKKLDVVVYWPDTMIEKYDTCILSSLPEVFKPQLFTRKPQESVSLYKCLEAFLREEPLGPEDMWYCPGCKKHRQAIKKLDLWRLPEILVIHLKRFSYSRFLNNKLETYVDFPVHDLDLSTYISHKKSQSSIRYMLYGTSNHYGVMGGGHYTAFIDHGRGRWYEFDDEKVYPISEDRVKTSAAYVLFYRRVPAV